MKKSLYLALIIIFLIVNIVLFYRLRNNLYFQKVSFDVSNILECENISDISLIIYYIEPLVHTRFHWTVDMLINNYDNKIVVDGNKLKDNFDILNQIDKGVFVQVEKHSHMNVRVYYVIESKERGKLLEVALWGDGNSMFVNRIEIQENDIFYNMIIPFLPTEIAYVFRQLTQGDGLR